MAMTPAERKREERKRKALYLKERGAKKISFTMFRGTLKALDEILEAEGYEQQAEFFTLATHGLNKLRKEDPEIFERIMNPGN